MTATQTTRPAISSSVAISRTPAGPDSLSGQCSIDPQRAPAAEGQDSPQATKVAKPSVLPSAGSKTSRSHIPSDIQADSAAADNFPGGQDRNDAQGRAAAGDQAPVPAKFQPTPKRDAPVRDQAPPAASAATTPKAPPLLADPIMKFAAARLWDVEAIRIAIENRVRQFEKKTADKDGVARGSGIDADVRSMSLIRELVSGEIDAAGIVAHMEAMVETLKADEHKAELYLCRLMRKHPLNEWRKTRPGVGEKQLARLLGAIGDPYWNDRDGVPRTIASLNRYCGMDVVDGEAPRRVSGKKGTWSPPARMRLHQVAKSCLIKDGKPDKNGNSRGARSPYRDVYDAYRAEHADDLHQKPCLRCGPKGDPAPVGSALSDGHKMARALRAAGKEILADLWREAERIHLETPVGGQSSSEDQPGYAADGPDHQERAA